MKNPEATTAQVVRKYQKKITADLSFFVENMVIDIKHMYGFHVSAQKAYKAKRKILESTGGRDHVKSFKDLQDYLTS